ncbi:sulfite reductase (NADPH) hemoprotein beta-component [Povalibacter uvarum]|uniref:Sulfite reductase (NADPH) hemoprotein beta-component n=1 Tax=Povalibacter uvarum TaxID=732238 RepID=A0A841HN89_9GAMM|nr:nitrite/sulfite reductase [Povalibacter uvarum]MBB6093542.1 sulfite reductase (NADPH) hemoprotein beta-component [Povalibacter uvarum]
MYQYDQIDQRLVDERVAQFRDQTRRFLAGELSDDDFRSLRLRNGLYIQKYAPMLRVSVPYGLLSSRQVRMFARIAREYDKGYGHFTTRQNLQYNWPKLELVPDILALLASVEMHAIQTSGNCIRNVTADHLAGIAPDEVEDPRPWCEYIRQWATLHPEFSYLPRKFKIAVTGSPQDRAASKVHDIGLHLVRNDQGEVGFEVLVGGGLGRMPMIGHVIRKFLPKHELLSYLEAILRVYNLEGRRDNIHKARIKVLVKAVGPEKFAEMVEAEWQASRDFAPVHDAEGFARISAFFTPPKYETLADEDVLSGKPTEFRAWYQRNTKRHKVPGYRAVFLSLKSPNRPPGDITEAEMDRVADLSDQYSLGMVRATHDQNLIFADVRQRDLYSLWQSLKLLDLATPNIGTLTDMICCPGLDFCSLANARSIPIAKQINERFDNFDYLYDLGDIELKMSGCMNACGHHHVGHIGILGVDKNGEEWYQITLGGSASGPDAALGQVIGPSVAYDDVAETIDRILNVYISEREEGERFIDTFRRVGVKPFKARVYAPSHQAA